MVPPERLELPTFGLQNGAKPNRIKDYVAMFFLCSLVESTEVFVEWQLILNKFTDFISRQVEYSPAK